MAINFNKAEFVLSAVKPSTFIRDGRRSEEHTSELQSH